MEWVFHFRYLTRSRKTYCYYLGQRHIWKRWFRRTMYSKSRRSQRSNEKRPMVPTPRQRRPPLPRQNKTDASVGLLQSSVLWGILKKVGLNIDIRHWRKRTNREIHQIIRESFWLIWTDGTWYIRRRRWRWIIRLVAIQKRDNLTLIVHER